MPAKKMDAADIETVDRIAQKYAAFAASRSTLEIEVRRTLQDRLDAQEALIAADVLSAMRRGGISNAALMRAIGKQNPDRWKTWLQKWEPVIPQEMTDAAEAATPDPTIAYEIAPSNPEWKVNGLDKIYQDGYRMFKMRSHRYPHEIGRKDAAGFDCVLYNPTIPEVEQSEFGTFLSNPGWGNTPNAPFGDARTEILSAIKAWIEKHPEAPE